MADPKPIIALAKELALGNLDRTAFLQGMAREITQQLDCTRASYWRYEDVLRSKIRLVTLYDAGTDEYVEGMVLSEDDFSPYFEAMRESDLIVAPDARSHPATECFTELYFEPLNIFSLLDVGITVGDEPLGLFCCENVSFVKQWSDDDVNFLRQTAALIGMVLKNAN